VCYRTSAVLSVPQSRGFLTMAIAGGTLVISTIAEAQRRETCLSDLPVASGLDHEQIDFGRDVLALPWMR